MKTQNITLRLLRHAELAQFLHDILHIVRENAIALPQLQSIVVELEGKAQKLGISLHQDKKKPLTVELKALDLRRDNAIQGVHHLAKAYAYHHLPQMVTAARALLDQFKLYRSNMAYQNYRAESAFVSDFIRDCTQPKLAAAVAQLNLGEWMGELDAANQAFDNCFLQRTRAIAAIEKTDMLQLRGNCTILYRRLCDMLMAQYIITDGEEPYKTCISQFNALTDQYKQLLRSRQTKKEIV